MPFRFYSLLPFFIIAILLHLWHNKAIIKRKGGIRMDFSNVDLALGTLTAYDSGSSVSSGSLSPMQSARPFSVSHWT